MAKVLLVDTNFSAVPLYKELLALGHEVHVVGGNPSDCLAKQVKNYWQINYADLQALDNLVTKEKFDFVVPGCTDRSYESCSILFSHKYPGIDNPQANKNLSNKGYFKKWAQNRGLPVARSIEYHPAELRWPLIVKPVDGFSGKGITVLTRPDQQVLIDAISYAKQSSVSKEYLMEDYVDGQLYSHSAFLSKHKIVRDFIVREDRTVNPFVVDTSHVMQDFSNLIRMKLRNCIESISEELKLVDGLIHTQFILNNDQFYLIELTRRCPGDLYSQMIEMSTEFAYSRAYVSRFIGLESVISSEYIEQLTQSVMRHTVTVEDSRNLGHLHFLEPHLIERWIPLSLVGDQLKPSPDSRIGILFCKAQDKKEFARLYESTLARKLYEIIE